MSSSDRVRDGSAPRHETPPTGQTTADADPYASWLDRMQRARVRHAAITKNLYTWANYKSWAERVKDSWEEGDSAPEAGAPKNGSIPGR
jgi:hypothetical protein